jgi:hypothetical protein
MARTSQEGSRRKSRKQVSVIPGCTCNHPNNWNRAVIWHNFDCRYRLEVEARKKKEFIDSFKEVIKPL